MKIHTTPFRTFIVAAVLLAGACTTAPEQVTPAPPPQPQVAPEVAQRYAARVDGGNEIPAVPAKYLTDRNIRREVDYWADEKPGTIIVDPWDRFLYFILPDDRAIRYGVAVGDDGRAFAGEGHIPYSRDWPSWRPTDNMIKEFPDLYGPLRDGMEGGVQNPMGARALYIHQGNKDTLYRIHGTSDMGAIGQATTAGCIRMFHQDVIELEQLYRSGARVIVRTEAERGKGTVPPGELMATMISAQASAS